MNIISSYMLLLLLITLAIDFSEQIKWITEPRTINVCKGNDADLIWELDEEENKISKLEWYFNSKILCTSSDSDKFTVNPSYHDRIERLSKTEIRLKNISLDDEGIYILFPLLKWSTSQNMQNISLQVLEPPTNKCTCKISCMSHSSKLACEATTSDCGRSRISAIWKRNTTFEVLGERNYILINSSFQDNEILCCPEGTAMKCADNPGQFCTSLNIPHHDHEKASQGGNKTPHTDPTTTLAPHQGEIDATNLHFIKTYAVLVCSSQGAIVFLLVFTITYLKRKTKNNKDLDQSILIEPTHKEETKPLLEEKKAADSTLTQLFDPEHEANKETTEQKPNTDSGTMRVYQALHHAFLCKICYDNNISTVFIPCNHMATCASCSISLQCCPVCRSLIK